MRGQKWYARLGAATLVVAIPALTLVTAPPAAAAAPTNVRVWSGSTPFTDTHGDVWSAANGFVGGTTFVVPPTTVNNLGYITDSQYSAHPEQDPSNALWGTGRSGVTAWSAPVANGRYRVELRLLDPTYATAGQRVFNVKAEGGTVLKGVDVAGSVKQKVTTERVFLVTVNDGTLNLAFNPTAGEAIVSSMRADKVPAGFVGRPGPGTTGPDDAEKTPVTANNPDGTYRLSTSQASLDIQANVIVTANNVTLSNSIIRGGSQAGAVIAISKGVTGFRLVDSLVEPASEHVVQPGVYGHDFTVLRTEITGTTDGVDIPADGTTTGTSTVQDSWLHDTRFINDGNRPTHNDGVQVLDNTTVVVDHNTITGNRNSALQLSTASTAVTFSNNFVDDGGATINVDGGAATVTGNVFWRHQRLLNCAILGNPGNSTANTFVDPKGTVSPRSSC